MAVRFVAGVFAGNNSLTVTASLLDPQTGASLGEFAVERWSNPGGYGSFRNPERGTARRVANEIAAKVLPPGTG